MKTISLVFLLTVSLSAVAATPATFRPPAVPLAVNEPRFSLWSPADALTDAETMHWSRDPQPLSILGEVDGRAWRLCGREPVGVPAARQLSVRVGCTQTTYTFDAGGRTVEVRFSTPVIPGDWDVFSRPVTYLTVKGAKAKVTVSPAFATDDDAAAMVTNVTTVAGCRATSIERAEPQYLTTGDRLRPNGGRIWLVEAGDRFVLGFDAVKDMTFLGQEVRAWWRRGGKPFETMLGEALGDYPRLMREMDAFDAKMEGWFLKVGGRDYATLAELAWRQSFGACALVASPEGEMLYFSMEETSNGCVGTVDVFYPQFPHLMLAGPDLVRATLRPMMAYAASDKWPFPFAPHDLGGFPKANGQWYAWSYAKDPTGVNAKIDKMMPVEECGNMLLCLAALDRLEGKSDFVLPHWEMVKGWAEYLRKGGFDPENQLCTDDFAGHLAHNANLSVKSILAFGTFARLAERKGERELAADYRKLAEDSVGKWMTAAKRQDGKGTRLAFDKPDTWSQKYNLVWDRLLGLDLFPRELGVAEAEECLRRRDLYGTPLDSRVHWCKVDWLVWCASMSATREDFMSLVAPVVSFLNATPDRVALPDLYYTETATLTRHGPAKDRFPGFNARPVVGAVYLPLLLYAYGDRPATTGLFCWAED